MIQNDLFLTTVVMFLLSVVALIIILSIVILYSISFIKVKQIKITPLNLGILIISTFILYLGLPFWLLGLAYSSQDKNAEILHKSAITFSIIPSVKNFMQTELGAYYMTKFEGEKAIIAFEKSLKNKNNKYTLATLCLLYSFKGDRQKAIKMCTDSNLMQNVAINYILKKDYNTALNIINQSIKTDNRKTSCLDHTIKAHIYRKLKQQTFFEQEYKKVKLKCPDIQQKKFYKNTNYYEDLYAQKKKEFKF